MRTIVCFAFLIIATNAYNCILTGGGNGYAVSIPQTYHNVLDHGAKGDGETDNSQIINSLLKLGNGIIVLSGGGKFAIHSPISFVTDSTALCIGEGTTLVIDDGKQAMSNLVGQAAIIIANKVNNIAVTGTGSIQGNGQSWWNNDQISSSDRPPLIYFKDGTQTLIRDISISNPPRKHMVMGNSNTEITNVHCYAPSSTLAQASQRSHNTDGVDVRGTPTWIHDSYFDTGDDDVAILASNVLVENLVIKAGHGISIGSLCAQAITGVTVRNITFSGTTNGIRIKTDQGSCAGSVTNTVFKNIQMTNVPNSIIITETYDPSFLQMKNSGQNKINLLKSKIATQGTNQAGFTISGVTFKDITTINTQSLGSFSCTSQCLIAFQGTISGTLAPNGTGWQCTDTHINTSGASSVIPALPVSCF